MTFFSFLTILVCSWNPFNLFNNWGSRIDKVYIDGPCGFKTLSVFFLHFGRVIHVTHLYKGPIVSVRIQYGWPLKFPNLYVCSKIGPGNFLITKKTIYLSIFLKATHIVHLCILYLWEAENINQSEIYFFFGKERVGRVVWPNFGQPVLTSSFQVYALCICCRHATEIRMLKQFQNKSQNCCKLFFTRFIFCKWRS